MSIMGFEEDDWSYLAAAADGSGAHILELNFSCPQMARPDAGHHIGQKFGLIEKYTAAAKRACNIPVIAKMTPNITDMLPAALAAQEGGADGISAINTVKSISHLDLGVDMPVGMGGKHNAYTDTSTSMRQAWDGITSPMSPALAMPTIQGQSSISGFSGKSCRPIGLRFVSELSQDKRLTIPISGMGGIYTWHDAVEYMSLGASNLQVTTSVMQHGVRIVEDMKDGLLRHLRRNNATSPVDLIGKGNQSITDPAELDAFTEVCSVIDKDICIGCGACEAACKGGAAQAITLVPSSSPCGRVAVVDESKCVGCKLCEFVCPVNAVQFEVRNRIPRPRFAK